MIKDSLNPTSFISFINQNEPSIVNKSTLFYIFADDGQGSGLSQVYYKINDSNWIEYIEAFNLSNYQYGVYQISFYSIDLAGNIESINSTTVSLVNIIKPSDIQISGYDIFLVSNIILIVIIFISVKIRKHQTVN